MKKLFNLKLKKSTRQRLRSRPTKAEKILWYHLKGSNLGGYKFRRQQGVGSYVVDFYCPIANLAVELDGDSHYQNGAAVRDAVRQKFIEKCGICVLRFTNNEIEESLPNVLEVILQKLSTTPNPSSPRRGKNKLSIIKQHARFAS